MSRLHNFFSSHYCKVCLDTCMIEIFFLTNVSFHIWSKDIWMDSMNFRSRKSTN